MKPWCRRPETTRTDFGTGSGPLSSLALNSRNFACQLQETHGHSCILQTRHNTFGVGHWMTDFRQGLMLDGRLASGGGARSRAIRGNSHRSSWGIVRDKPLYHHQLVSTASAPHPESAMQPNPEVAHNTSGERRNHETLAFRNRRCNHLSRAWETTGMRQVPRAP